MVQVLGEATEDKEKVQRYDHITFISGQIKAHESRGMKETEVEERKRRGTERDCRSCLSSIPHREHRNISALVFFFFPTQFYYSAQMQGWLYPGRGSEREPSC